MNVIVLYEHSGVVRDAFLAKGHNAISCDIQPNYSGPHLKCDVHSLDLTPYDLAIMHPPCTHLSVSGARWFKMKQREQEEAISEFRWCLDIPIPRIAIENPVGIISSIIRPPDQIIQPWMFGDGECKATCLWLRDLPKLVPTNIVKQRRQTVAKMGPSSERSRYRSRTFPGIAQAMAEQWGRPNAGLLF